MPGEFFKLPVETAFKFPFLMGNLFSSLKNKLIQMCWVLKFWIRISEYIVCLVEFKDIFFLYLKCSCSVVTEFWGRAVLMGGYLQMLEIINVWERRSTKKRKLQKLSHLTTWGNVYTTKCYVRFAVQIYSAVKMFIEINECHNCRSSVFLIGTPMSYLVVWI